MAQKRKGKRRAKAADGRSRKLQEAISESAVLHVMERWAQIEREGSASDGSDADLEGGPEEERTVEGDRVVTCLDKVFGGYAVHVIRKEEGRALHYPLGRVSEVETPATVLGRDPTFFGSVDPPPRGSSVPPGVWRNDQNGFVREQVTGLSRDAAVDALVRAFQRQCGPPGADARNSRRQRATNDSVREDGGSVIERKRSRKRTEAFTAVLFKGDLMGERVGRVTEALASRFGLPVLAVATMDTGDGGGGEGLASEAYGGPDAHEAARTAAGDLYEMVNQEVPAVRTEAQLDAWAAKQAKGLRKLADGLEKSIAAKKRTHLCARAEKIRFAAERLVFGVRNWELEEEDRRWQAEHDNTTRRGPRPAAD